MDVQPEAALVVGVRLRKASQWVNSLTNKLHWLFSSATRSATLRVGEVFFLCFLFLSPFLKRGEASVVSSYYFLTPIAGLALAALLLGEPFGVRDLLGLVAIVAGIALINHA